MEDRNPFRAPEESLETRARDTESALFFNDFMMTKVTPVLGLAPPVLALTAMYNGVDDPGLIASSVLITYALETIAFAGILLPYNKIMYSDE